MAIYLMVRFRVPLHQVEAYERIFGQEFLPLIREHGFELVGAFRTLVGEAGGYVELWRFEDMSDLERKWKSLFSDERTSRILEKTGPLVQGETTSILEEASFFSEP
jgi:hypothetical protein